MKITRSSKDFPPVHSYCLLCSYHQHIFLAEQCGLNYDFALVFLPQFNELRLLNMCYQATIDIRKETLI